MIKEKNPLINLDLEKKQSIFIEYYNVISDSLYSLFDLIIEDPIESFCLECFQEFFAYFQLVAYIFDSAASKCILLIYLV